MNAPRKLPPAESQQHSDNRQILFDFVTNFVLPILASNGLWMAPDPAPLTAEETKIIFERITRHEAYEHQTLVMKTIDGKRVVVEDGKARTEED